MKSRYLRAISLAALPCALIGTPALAQSNLNLYGQVDLWGGTQRAIGGMRAGVVQSGGMSTSYWGMKGSEDLGDGMKAVFALESFFQPQNGTIGRYPGDVFFSRNAYVGVESPYGRLTIGRQSSNLFLSTIMFNPFKDSFVFSPMVLHTYLGQGGQGVIGDTGWNSAVQYVSPSFYDVVGKAMYSLGNTPGQNGAKKWSAQLLMHGPLSVSAVYQYTNFSATPGDIGSALRGAPGLTSQYAAQLALSYNFGFVKAFAQYQHVGDTLAGGSYSVNTGQAGVSVPLGPGEVLASYAYSKSGGPGSGAIRRSWAIGYDYSLSKRTDIYAAYLNDQLSGQSGGDALGVGLRVAF
ncbi:porin [Pandoraea fibrosis]|uniref:Porin n=1 Tax=Pandoraea fibrosis TaxID=1891094 RepID=A0ABX6HRT0_9BURK|nr:porin [Pandoraea fibrosis]QHE93227.1 porin [Pandoraea fibrosis]QHF13214.1 porin [Pandoraea fibrosis]